MWKNTENAAETWSRYVPNNLSPFYIQGFQGDLTSQVRVAAGNQVQRLCGQSTWMALTKELRFGIEGFGPQSWLPPNPKHGRIALE